MAAFTSYAAPALTRAGLPHTTLWDTTSVFLDTRFAMAASLTPPRNWIRQASEPADHASNYPIAPDTGPRNRYWSFSACQKSARACMRWIQILSA